MGAGSAVDYLASLERFGMRLGLERMKALLAALGHPERGLPAIHVVGTNGKSSTTRFCAAALATAGMRVGAYLSPHIQGWHERIQLDGAPVGPAYFGQLVSRVAAAAPAVVDAVGEEPTQFEVLTAAALLAFCETEVDACVVEAGLGGRFDATNVLAARVVGLTNVSLDHTDVLGETRAEILGEKLGVLSPGALLLVGELDDVLFLRAAELAHAAGAMGARRLTAEQIAAERDAVEGGYQAANAALGLALARVFLGARQGELDLPAARCALRDAAPPGRLERTGDAPLVLRDGAHNPDGMRALVAELDGALGSRRPRVALLGLQADKAADAMLDVLLPHVDLVVATTSGHARALPAADVARRVRGPQAVAVEDADAALEAARERAGPDGAVLVTGSLYLLERLAQTGQPGMAPGRETG